MEAAAISPDAAVQLKSRPKVVKRQWLSHPPSLEGTVVVVRVEAVILDLCL
jgi:hypothetical protein